MKKILLFFLIGFLLIGGASFFLPQLAMSLGDHGLTITIIGFIILVLVVVFVLQKLIVSGMKSETIPNGLPATATVISCKQGSFKVTFGGVQEIYQLIIEVNVQNKQGETWPATIKAMIPLTQIATFQPGVSFLVLYDPKNKKKVIIDQNQAAAKPDANIPGYGTMSQQNIQSAKHNAPQDITMRLEAANSLLQELKISGVTAAATVSSKDVLYSNYLPYIDAIQLKVQVNSTDRPSFEGIVVALLGKNAQIKTEVGNTVYVKYDRNNSQRVCLSGTDQPDTAQTL